MLKIRYNLCIDYNGINKLRKNSTFSWNDSQKIPKIKYDLKHQNLKKCKIIDLFKRINTHIYILLLYCIFLYLKINIKYLYHKLKIKFLISFNLGKI